MAILSNEQLLERVKTSKGFTGNNMDDRLEALIDDAKNYMRDGGVRDSLLNDSRAAGAIARYVIADLDGEPIPDFVDKRIAQLELVTEEEK